MSKIRLDYSWVSPEIRKGIEPQDPTPRDLAITQDDFKKIGMEKFEKIRETIQEATGASLNGKTKYVLMSKTGNTLLLSEEGVLYDREGDNVGSLSVDWEKKQIRDYPNFGFSFQLRVDERLCAGTRDFGNLCDQDSTLLLRKGIDRSIYSNSLNYRIFDHKPPQVGGELLSELNNILFPSGALMSTLQTGKIEGGELLFSLPEITRGDARHRLSIFADGVLLESPKGEKEVRLPVETKKIVMRVTDPFGNAGEFEYSRGIREGEKVFFLECPAGQRDRISLFQAHIRRLIREGYSVKISDKTDIDPLSYLMQKYGDRLFSKPEVHKNREIIIPVFGIISLPIQWSGAGENAVWLKKVTDWFSGEELSFVDGLDHLDNQDFLVKLGMDAESLMSLDRWGRLAKKYETYKASGIPESLLPPGEARETPQLITLNPSGKPEIPESCQKAKFRFMVNPETAWGRSPEESGGGEKSLGFEKMADDLIARPISIRGRLEAVVIDFPVMWSSVPEKGVMDVEKNPQGFSWKTTDPFGNTILFGDNKPTLVVVPHFSPNNGKTLNVDLSGFGLGVLSHLVSHERTPPTGKTGSHHQYDLFSNFSEQPSSLQTAVLQVEVAEADFGFVPGAVVHAIRVVEESEVNASVRQIEPGEIRFNEGILDLEDGFPYVGFHEAFHSIDFALGVSADPEFEGLFHEVSVHNTPFLSWISEFNFLPDSLGGHAWESYELFPSLLIAQFHPALKEKFAQSDSRFVETYRQFLEVILVILKARVGEGKLSAEAPIFKKLENLLSQTKDVKRELPLPFRESQEFEERKISRLLSSKHPRPFVSGSYLFRKDGERLTGGAALGVRVESDLFPIAPLATGGSLFLSPYLETNLDFHWKDSWMTLVPEAGVTFKKLRLVDKYPLLLGAGYAFEYMPFQGHRTESGAAMTLATNLQTGVSDDSERIGLDLHSFPHTGDLWIALQFSKKF